MNRNDKLSPGPIYQSMIDNGIVYFCGVPDSSLSSFGWYLQKRAGSNHDIAVNEGSAVGLAIGSYLSSGKIPLVYMQNSGLGNAINPLISLADELVMGIPIVLLIGWRGKPGTTDEPQHLKQGAITTKLLKAMDVPYIVLSRDNREAAKQIVDIVKQASAKSRPVAILVEQSTFNSKVQTINKSGDYPLSREEAISAIAGTTDNNSAVVATTGKASRELFEYRAKAGQGHKQDLLVIGGMGHASAIAVGIAQKRPKLKVYCIDGDGALLMHMGSLTAVTGKKLPKYYHFVINNGSHDSVGGQPTAAFDVDLAKIARASGYAHCYSVRDTDSLSKLLATINKLKGPVFVEIRVKNGARENLGRPSIKPKNNKDDFMAFLNES